MIINIDNIPDRYNLDFDNTNSRINQRHFNFLKSEFIKSFSKYNTNHLNIVVKKFLSHNFDRWDINNVNFYLKNKAKYSNYIYDYIRPEYFLKNNCYSTIEFIKHYHPKSGSNEILRLENRKIIVYMFEIIIHYLDIFVKEKSIKERILEKYNVDIDDYNKIVDLYTQLEKFSNNHTKLPDYLFSDYKKVLPFYKKMVCKFWKIDFDTLSFKRKINK